MLCVCFDGPDDDDAAAAAAAGDGDAEAPFLFSLLARVADDEEEEDDDGGSTFFGGAGGDVSSARRKRMPSTSSRATSALACMDGTMTKELKSVRTTLMLDVPVWAFATKLSVNRGSFPSLSSSSLLLS